MKATAEIQAVPIGAGVSVRREVQRAYDVIRASGLACELHAAGTNVEGELSAILQLIGRLHEVLHREGTIRLITFIKLATRTDKASRRRWHGRWLRRAVGAATTGGPTATG